MSDREAILQAIQSFAASYNSGDLAGLLSYYADDLVKLRQGAPADSKVETERRLKDVFARFATRVDVENLETEVAGEMAFTRGTFVVTLAPRDGGETQRIGRRYLEVWRKREGRWCVARTMDNSEDVADRPMTG
jgi:uncharacterized protein (TIGR02246 family)